MAKKTYHASTFRVEKPIRKRMIQEAKALGLSLTAYLIHCHNMWIRRPETDPND